MSPCGGYVRMYGTQLFLKPVSEQGIAPAVNIVYSNRGYNCLQSASCRDNV